VTATGSAAFLLALAIFVLYFAAYPVRHLHLPVGFDPPYYVWRADFLGSQGVGTGSLASRPGYTVLSAVLGSVTGRSQLELVAILSLVLVSLVALAVGAFAVTGLGADRRGWVVAVAAAGIVLGPSHLVGENLSNTLNVGLEVAALVPLALVVRGGRGFWVAVGLLVAAGLAHWDFLAVFMAALVVAALLAWPSSRRAMAGGSSFFHTEAGVLAGAGAGSAAIVGALVLGVFRAPVVTIEVGEDRVLYWKKFVRDLARLVVPAAAALGYWAVRNPERGLGAGPGERNPRRFARRILFAWAAVSAAGILAGAITLRVPPARFLALLVALPGAVAVAAAIGFLSRWAGVRIPSRVPGGRSAVVSGAVVVVLLGALAVPTVFRWYRYPVLLQDAALQQAEVAGNYVGALPSNQAVIFLVDYYVRPFPYGPVLAERTIRIELPATRQDDAYFFVGNVRDLLAGRQTPPPNDRLRITTAAYREEVRPLLAATPTVLILQGLAGDGFQQAKRLGARLVGPGVEVLGGAPPGARVEAPAAVRPVPSLGGGLLWGAVVLALLWVAGAGWTRLVLSPHTGAEAFFSLAPVVGAAALLLGGLVADRAGLRLGGAGGVITYVVVALGGAIAAVLNGRLTRVGRNPQR
jgi:hypothetical protein